MIIANTGPLPSSGGHIEVSVIETNIPDTLELELARASTRGAGSEAESQASVANLAARLVTGSGQSCILELDYLSARAEAECTSQGVRITGQSTVQGLKIDGMAVHVTGAANQVVEFACGRLIINYQSGATTSTEGSITVAGLVVEIRDCGTGTIGLAHADIVCGTTPPTQDCSDRVTGGGFIFGTPSGERANFGVGGGIQNGRLWGHLNYIDHGTGMHVKASAVTGYQVVDAVTRMITYDVTIDGAIGTATVIVADNGEPGREDIFMIELSTGYMAGGDLGGVQPGGGNIQLHKPKCKNGGGNGGHDDDDDGNGKHKCDNKCKPKCKAAPAKTLR